MPQYYFWFRKSRSKNGSGKEGQLMCIIKNGTYQSKPLSTKIKLLRDNWNSKYQYFEGIDAAKMDRMRKDFIKRLDYICEELEQQYPNTIIDPNEIVVQHKLNKQKSRKLYPTLLECFKFYIQKQQELVGSGKIKLNTINTYFKRLRNLQRFLAGAKSLKIKASEFNEIMADNMQHWMYREKYAQSYINKHLRLVKSVQVLAKKEGNTDAVSLAAYGFVSVKEKVPVVLDKIEIALIENCNNYSQILREVADGWLFCVETGFAYSDYMELKDYMLLQDVDGTYWIDKNRRKSEEPAMVPLSNKAMKLLKKYGGIEGLPRMSNQKTNLYLKDVAGWVGIKKKLHHHMARKTFCHVCLNYKRMRETTIAQVMGWTSTRQLRAYARIDRETIKSEFFKNVG